MNLHHRLPPGVSDSSVFPAVFRGTWRDGGTRNRTRSRLSSEFKVLISQALNKVTPSLYLDFLPLISGRVLPCLGQVLLLEMSCPQRLVLQQGAHCLPRRAGIIQPQWQSWESGWEKHLIGTGMGVWEVLGHLSEQRRFALAPLRLELG